MHFLSSRSPEPAGSSTLPIQDKIFTNRVVKRVATIFNSRKRTFSKPSHHDMLGNAPVGFIRDNAIVYTRSSCSSSTGSPDEIRRPSGLGRRASLMESLQLPIRSSELESNGDRGESRSFQVSYSHVSVQDLLQNARPVQVVCKYSYLWNC